MLLRDMPFGTVNLIKNVKFSVLVRFYFLQSYHDEITQRTQRDDRVHLAG